MSKERDFLLLYPYLDVVRQKAETLAGYLDNLCSAEDEPESDWIPVLHEACTELSVALDADSVRSLDQSHFLDIRESICNVERSFRDGTGLLFEARAKIWPALASLDNLVRDRAERAFGEWGAYFFLLCVSDLPVEIFCPNYYEPAAKRKSSTFDRDQLWLKWRDQDGLTPAKIRDRWNQMLPEERTQWCPTAANTIPSGEGGCDLVTKALRRAAVRKLLDF